MNNVVPISRDEYKGLRDLCRKWESHALSAEDEVMALRGQYRKSLILMREAVKAHENNDPIAMGVVIDEMRAVGLGE